MEVDDLNITLASGSANPGAANGAGITVDTGTGTDATFTYNGTLDTWEFNKPTSVEVAGSLISEFGRTGAGTYDLTISDIGEGAAQLWFNAQTNDTGFNFRPKDSSGNNTNALYISPDGGVQIGATAGFNGSKLRVNGKIVAGDVSTTTGDILLQGYYGQGTTITIGSERSSGGAFIGYGVEPSTTTQHQFISSTGIAITHSAYVAADTHRWWTASSGSAVTEGNQVTTMVQRMIILADGRVGINRTPGITNSKLEVGGADDVPLINVEASGNTGGMGIGSTGLQLFHGTSSRMTINSSGDVGIGTTTPEHHLHVTEPGATNEDGIVKIGGSAASLGLELRYNQAGATQTDIISNPTYTNASALMKICVDGDANANQLVLKGNGNVGIDTDDPLGKFVVSEGGAEGIEFFPRASSGVNTTQHWNRSGSVYVKNRTIALNHEWTNGTTDPAMNLIPDGNSTFLVIKAKAGTFLSTANLSLYGTNPNANGGSLVSRASVQAISDGSAFGTKMHLLTNNTSNVETKGITIDASQHVGLATDSPSSRLELGTLPDDDWITFEQSGRKNALGGYFSSASTATLWKLKMTTGATDGSMNEIFRLSSGGKLTFMQNSAKEPINFFGTGTGTYNLTALYTGQSNTSNNMNNGIHFEMGRLTDSSTAEVRAFVVGARGGQSSFKVKEREAGVTQADGDYLAKMYELNADGFLSLYTGEATPIERTRMASYGTSFIVPPISSRTTSSKAALSVGTNAGYAAGVFAIKGSSSNDGMLTDSSTAREFRNVCHAHTAAAPSRYWHIKTNIMSVYNVMFVARVHGYSYGNGGHIVDIQRSGYAYSSHGNLTASQSANNGSSSDTLDVYFASDNYLCFRHSTPNSGYYNGYSFDIKMQSPTGYNFNFQILNQAINAASGNHF